MRGPIISKTYLFLRCALFPEQEANDNVTVSQTTCFFGRPTGCFMLILRIFKFSFLAHKKSPNQEKELEIKVHRRSRVEISNSQTSPKSKLQQQWGPRRGPNLAGHPAFYEVARESSAPAPASTIYNPQSTIDNPQSRIYNLQSTLYNLQSTIYNLRSTIHNLQSTIYNLQSTIYNLQSTIDNDIYNYNLQLHLPYTIDHLQSTSTTSTSTTSTIYHLHQQSTKNNLPSTIYNLLFTISNVPSTMYHQQCSICHLPSTITNPYPQAPIPYLQATISNRQSTYLQSTIYICNLQSAICNLQSAIRNLQSAILNLQSAICHHNLQSAI